MMDLEPSKGANSMTMTLRDQALPSRIEAWRDLRGLRVDPPGAAASDGDRLGTFQTALEQSQQLFEAAERAGYATRPLQLFYGLSQGGRAVAAASVRLPTTATDRDGDESRLSSGSELPWKLRGHGIKAHTATARIAEVVVQADSTGAFPGVAEALGTECLAQEKVKVGDLWALLPESFSAPLEAVAKFPALSLESRSPSRQTSDGFDKATLGYVPSEVHHKCGDDQEALRPFLDHYSSLHGWAYPFGNGNPLGWERQGTAGTFMKLPIYWPYPSETSADYAVPIRELKATRYRTEHDWWVFPKIGRMTGPLHPLLAWWAVLLALSTMARYEPCEWASMISIDSSRDASPIEHLLDQALDVIPSTLLQAIHTASNQQKPRLLAPDQSQLETRLS